jgi:hypothetical protein
MKTSLVLKPRKLLDRSEAWGCFTANLALPGSGSLVAGRWIGYPQLILAFIGVGISLATGIQLILWFLSHWKTLANQTDDPVDYFIQVWSVFKWPLAGLAIFGISLIWATMTSLVILAETKKANLTLPPKL